MDCSSLSDGEAQVSASERKRGGWITVPFILVASASLTIGVQGWFSNLMIYMIDEYNTKKIDSTQVWNVVHGFNSMLPILGAIIADAFLGSFSVIWMSSLISLLSVILLLLTATLDVLKPLPCGSGSSSCHNPTKLQYGVLYTAVTLGIIGTGGSRWTFSAIGADQFQEPKNQARYFNWFFFVLNAATLISGTVIVWVESHVSWAWGFGICLIANVVGFAVFVSGSRFYRHVKPQGSPFTYLARVIVAAFRKRKGLHSSKIEDYHHKSQSEDASDATRISTAFKFLNRAALIREGDIQSDGSISNPWKLCTLQQVEDLKTLIKIFPLWSSSIILSVPLTTLSGFSTLQALSMDLHLGPNWSIPAGSFHTFLSITTCLAIIVMDQVVYPIWVKIIGRFPPPLQRVGIGHVLSALSMAISAFVESRRLKVAHSHNLTGTSSVVPMSVFWLVPQMAMAGIAEAFHLPGNTSLYHQEFPKSLKNISTAMVALSIACSFYINTAYVGIFHKVTNWLPDNINQGRMDNVYWVLFVIGVFNFGYYLVCVWLYKRQNVTRGDIVAPSKDDGGN